MQLIIRPRLAGYYLKFEISLLLCFIHQMILAAQSLTAFLWNFTDKNQRRECMHFVWLSHGLMKNLQDLIP